MSEKLPVLFAQHYLSNGGPRVTFATSNRDEIVLDHGDQIERYYPESSIREQVAELRAAISDGEWTDIVCAVGELEDLLKE